MRAEFRLWHERDDFYYAMFDADGAIVRVDYYAAANRQINKMMTALIESLRADKPLAQRLFQVEFHCSSSGDRLATLVYHRHLEGSWLPAAERVAQRTGASIIGRSRGQRLVAGRDFVTEHMRVDGVEYRWRQPEGSFTQANASVNRAMLQWASEWAAQCGDTLLELHCGSGNFTLPLARHFEQTLAADSGRGAITALRQNLRDNSITNAYPLRMSTLEVWQALSGERRFRRLHDAPHHSAHFDALLVDPPRAGLDDAALACARTVPQMLYISCNPQSLSRDLEQLPQLHMHRLALFDQFPYTPHIECGVWLSNHRSEEALRWPSPP